MDAQRQPQGQLLSHPVGTGSLLGCRGGAVRTDQRWEGRRGGNRPYSAQLGYQVGHPHVFIILTVQICQR